MKIFLFKISKKVAKKFINLFNRSYLNFKEIFFSLPLLEKPFPDKPFGNKPYTTRDNYLILHKNAISKKYKKITQNLKSIQQMLSCLFINEP